MHFPKTRHNGKVTVQREETRAECLQCDFRIAPSLRANLMVFDAEMHGKVTDVVCGEQHESMIISLIRDIWSGVIQREDL
jgi:hypothetical protein